METQWLNTMDAQGLTALDRAMNCNHQAIVSMMLSYEDELTEESLTGSTPLHRAAVLGLYEAVRALLDAGADAMAQDLAGETALHKAVRQGHGDVVELLTPLTDVNAISDEGMAPLHWAALTGAVETAQVLLAHGADPWLANDSLDGLTPIALASVMDYDALVGCMGRESHVA